MRAAVLQFAPMAAMQAALVGSHREAASLYQVALLYAQQAAPDERARLYEQLSYECYLTGSARAGSRSKRRRARHLASVWRAHA